MQSSGICNIMYNPVDQYFVAKTPNLVEIFKNYFKSLFEINFWNQINYQQTPSEFYNILYNPADQFLVANPPGIIEILKKYIKSLFEF